MVTVAARSRKRPRDRKAQIVAAAAGLFWERGYRQVSMADVAAAVEIGASALYRHFSGKSALVVAVLGEGLRRLETATDTCDSDVVRALTRATVEGREYAAVWDRAIGEIDTETALDLRTREDRVLERIAAAAREANSEPDADPETTRLRARAALAVIQSPSYHRAEVKGDLAVRLLAEAANACLAVPLPRGRADRAVANSASGTLLPRARSEVLVAVAGRMFAERGYRGASLGEIGEAAGIAGPSIYKHFPSKIDLLVAILGRGNEALWFALHQALAEATDPRDALGRLLASYISIVGASPRVVSVLLSELATLPVDQRAEYHDTQLRYVAEWVGLLRDWRPELTEPSARLLAHAAFAVVNALAHSDSTLGDGGTVPRERIRALSRAVLGLPVEDGS